MCIDTMNTYPKRSETRATSYLHFSVMFLLKKNVSTSDSEQSKTLLTIDERGSKLAKNSVLIAKCRLFDEARMVIKNYDSNYFWSIIVDSIDVFDCAYKV